MLHSRRWQSEAHEYQNCYADSLHANGVISNAALKIRTYCKATNERGHVVYELADLWTQRIIQASVPMVPVLDACAV
jgi:hypothetical protein